VAGVLLLDRCAFKYQPLRRAVSERGEIWGKAVTSAFHMYPSEGIFLGALVCLCLGNLRLPGYRFCPMTLRQLGSNCWEHRQGCAQHCQTGTWAGTSWASRHAAFPPWFDKIMRITCYSFALPFPSSASPPPRIVPSHTHLYPASLLPISSSSYTRSRPVGVGGECGPSCPSPTFLNAF